jgi:hypothetical protein
VIALPEWVIGIGRNGRSAWPESAHPPRARIRIGGKELGEAPLVRYRLPAGRYVVEAVRPDGTRRFQRVQVVAGRGELLSFR